MDKYSNHNIYICLVITYKVSSGVEAEQESCNSRALFKVL